MIRPKETQPISIEGTRLFVAYHSVDRAVVRACAPVLEQHGCTVDWKPHFTARDALSEEAAGQIQQCDLVLLFLSAAAKESQ